MMAAALLSCLFVSMPVSAQSNVEEDHKHAWGENIGWTNWRDAGGADEGVAVGAAVLSGYVWCENVGWVHVGDGTPDGGVDPEQYDNDDASDFGVNVDADGGLHGYAWGENIGWLNFNGGALAEPAQPARVECDGRLSGHAWSENAGWINLDDAEHYVATTDVPISCDMNGDGAVDGDDIQVFVDALLLGEADWMETCSGDLEAVPDGGIDADDVAAFVSCLLGE